MVRPFCISDTRGGETLEAEGAQARNAEGAAEQFLHGSGGAFSVPALGGGLSSSPPLGFGLPSLHLWGSGACRSPSSLIFGSGAFLLLFFSLFFGRREGGREGRRRRRRAAAIPLLVELLPLALLVQALSAASPLGWWCCPHSLLHFGGDACTLPPLGLC